MAIDYERAKKSGPKLKAMLTRALNVQKDATKPGEYSTLRRMAVLKACKAAVAEWEQWGAWPDGWARWQRALDDQYPVFFAPRLEEL